MGVVPQVCFNAVQNNTSLKLSLIYNAPLFGFNAVQNNTSLKLFMKAMSLMLRFNAVQNNTSLKPPIVWVKPICVLMQFKITHL